MLQVWPKKTKDENKKTQICATLAFKKQADNYGYSLLFGSKNNRLKNKTFLEYFKYVNVDGIAIICTDPSEKETIQLIESDFPIVVIDMFNSNTSIVTSDNDNVAYKLT